MTALSFLPSLGVLFRCEACLLEAGVDLGVLACRGSFPDPRHGLFGVLKGCATIKTTCKYLSRKALYNILYT